MYRKLRKLPEEFEAGIMIAIGYQDSHLVLPAGLREKAFAPRQRKRLSEIAFFEELGGKGIV